MDVHPSNPPFSLISSKSNERMKTLAARGPQHHCYNLPAFPRPYFSIPSALSLSLSLSPSLTHASGFRSRSLQGEPPDRLYPTHLHTTPLSLFLSLSPCRSLGRRFLRVLGRGNSFETSSNEPHFKVEMGFSFIW